MMIFVTILVAALVLLMMLGYMSKLEDRVEELELVILNSRIEWVDEE